jgi:hypothetical protein
MVRSEYVICYTCFMKTFLTLFLLCPLWVSCTQESTVPAYRPYALLIDRDALSLTGSTLIHEPSLDTIMARNDTLAYKRALIFYHAALHTSNRLNGKMGQVRGFELQDSTGLNVSYKLSPELVDSLQQNAAQLQARIR